MKRVSKRRSEAYTIGGLALLALAIAGGIWFWPEFRRYQVIRRM
jgi:hypothetical protein